MKRYAELNNDEKLVLKAKRRLEAQDNTELADMLDLFEREVNQGARSIMRNRILELLKPKGQRQTVGTGEMRLIF